MIDWIMVSQLNEISKLIMSGFIEERINEKMAPQASFMSTQ